MLASVSADYIRHIIGTLSSQKFYLHNRSPFHHLYCNVFVVLSAYWKIDRNISDSVLISQLLFFTYYVYCDAMFGCKLRYYWCIFNRVYLKSIHHECIVHLALDSYQLHPCYSIFLQHTIVWSIRSTTFARVQKEWCLCHKVFFHRRLEQLDWNAILSVYFILVGMYLVKINQTIRIRVYSLFCASQVHSTLFLL